MMKVKYKFKNVLSTCFSFQCINKSRENDKGCQTEKKTTKQQVTPEKQNL